MGLRSVHLSRFSPKSLQSLLVVLLGKSHVPQELWVNLHTHSGVNKQLRKRVKYYLPLSLRDNDSSLVS